MHVFFLTTYPNADIKLPEINLRASVFLFLRSISPRVYEYIRDLGTPSKLLFIPDAMSITSQGEKM
jgi:hypothetical protein